MDKEFIPHQESLELVGLGYDEPVEFFKDSSEEIFDMRTPNDAPCILWQQAFRWFREKYGLRIRNYGSVNYSGTLSEYFEIFKYGYGTSDKSLSIEVGALTYEEAELTCLKKLIEIVKN